MSKHFRPLGLAIAGLCLAALTGPLAAFAQNAPDATTPAPNTSTVERSAKGPTVKAI
jgi:hypothetical protein